MEEKEDSTIKKIMKQADKQTGKLTPRVVNELCSEFRPKKFSVTALISDIDPGNPQKYGWYHCNQGNINLTLTYPALMSIIDEVHGMMLHTLLTLAKAQYEKDNPDASLRLSEIRFILPIDGHYVYVEIKLEDNKVDIYDSFPAIARFIYASHIYEEIKKFISHENTKKMMGEKSSFNEHFKIDYISTSVQGNTNGCGYYATQALCYRANNRDVPTENGLISFFQSFKLPFNKAWLVFNETFNVYDYTKKERFPSGLEEEFIQAIDSKQPAEDLKEDDFLSVDISHPVVTPSEAENEGFTFI